MENYDDTNIELIIKAQNGDASARMLLLTKIQDLSGVW